MKKLLITTILASGVATSAFAADAIVYNEPTPPAAPMVEPESNWTGPYIGGQVGYGFVDPDLPGVDGEGIVGGVHAGYNYDLGGFVVGGEVDYDFADLEVEDDVLGDVGQIDGIARAKAKAGVDLGRVLPYVTAGGAYAHGDLAGEDVDDFGFLVGGGVDVAATDNIIVGAEYLYHNFNSFDDTDVDVDVHTVRAKASFKF
ncbi:outer membrane protein [Pararhizobium haloflavum]|uniref:outer membrane protein n=1 Tax=Pararhizobium haloflavum TaxID=2037914 RepID=UPI000C17FF7C|nr:outer membrane protein [Pararhizobium haloflavum]